MLLTKQEYARKISDLPLLKRCSQCGIEPNPLSNEGIGGRKILIVFERPNDVQWENRSWFADVGHPLFQALIYQKCQPESDTVATGVFLCRGEDKEPDKYEYCLVSLADTIKTLNPKLIFTVGEVATGAVLRLYNPRHFKQENRSGEYYGQCIPLNQEAGWDAWLAPVMDRNRIEGYSSAEMSGVANSWMIRHVIWALGMGRYRPPKYTKPSIELLYKKQEIIDAIDQASKCELTAFDYETSTLEPWRQAADLLTCSLAMGSRERLERTVAFPMTSPDVRRRWVEYLLSSQCKIGANIMYEHYWSVMFLNTITQNWTWDTCLGSRILDCAQGVSGLKRTTFVNLGIIGYDDTVADFMTENQDGTNNLSRMNPNELLTYNAYDSAYTYECALRQRDLLKVAF